MESFDGLEQFLKGADRALAKGPIAIVFAEDDTALSATLRHLAGQGFRALVICTDIGVPLPEDLPADIAMFHLRDIPTGPDAVAQTVTAIQAAAPEGTWFHWCYNAEFLFFPFCETRRVSEMLAFHMEERRRAMVGFTVDLYAPDLSNGAVDLENPMLDRTGYFALARTVPPHDHPLDRQLDFFGGLRWRFEEHVPKNRRRIDRVALFRSRAKDLVMYGDATFSDQEYNTYQCPWHHNLTCAIPSFRTAKALTQNPGSRNEIGSFVWRNSVAFDWSSRQLMDLGLMEPGQWF